MFDRRIRLSKRGTAHRDSANAECESEGFEPYGEKQGRGVVRHGEILSAIDTEEQLSLESVTLDFPPASVLIFASEHSGWLDLRSSRFY
jgi:hypothetical protein